MCKLVPFISTLSFNVSIFTLLTISVERYWVLFIKPMKKRKLFNLKRYLTTVSVIWLIGIALSLTKLLNYQVHIYPVQDIEICEPIDYILNKYETIGLVLIQYVTPTSLIIFIYLKIGFHFLFKPSMRNKQNLKRNSHVIYFSKFFLQVRLMNLFYLILSLKVAKTAFIIVVSFLLCWTPLQVFNFLNVAFPNLA
jgi:hypothetical protein